MANVCSFPCLLSGSIPRYAGPGVLMKSPLVEIVPIWPLRGRHGIILASMRLVCVGHLFDVDLVLAILVPTKPPGSGLARRRACGAPAVQFLFGIFPTLVQADEIGFPLVLEGGQEFAAGVAAIPLGALPSTVGVSVAGTEDLDLAVLETGRRGCS